MRVEVLLLCRYSLQVKGWHAFSGAEGGPTRDCGPTGYFGMGLGFRVYGLGFRI